MTPASSRAGGLVEQGGLGGREVKAGVLCAGSRHRGAWMEEQGAEVRLSGWRSLTLHRNVALLVCHQACH